MGHRKRRKRIARSGSDERNRVVIFGAIGVMVCALVGYIVTPSAAETRGETPGETKEEFHQRMRSTPQPVYE